MSSAGNPIKPKRRVRYKGTHPKKFHEKYKELNPQQYGEDVEKIMSRGATPAGTHRPICVSEILEILKPKKGESVLDATLGYGGHALHFLEKILPGGRLIGLDQDPIELPKTEGRLRSKGFDGDSLIIGQTNFSDARKFLQSQGIEPVNMIIADLGASSMQIDDPTRGFTFKADAPLDLRMNPQKGESVAALLSRIKEKDLEEMLVNNADEKYASLIAKALVKKRPKTTLQLADAVREILSGLSPKIQREIRDGPIRRTFQALRIEVNAEFAALDQFLEDLPQMLSKGGRVAILSFHSGEDRRVKKSFQALERASIYKKIAPDPIRATFEEQRMNPRSKSAKLRWAVRQ